MRLIPRILGAALLVAMARPLPVHAQSGRPILPSPPEMDVDALLDDAQTAADKGDDRTAYEAYVKAWTQRQSYEIASNLGSVELNLGKNRDAAEHLAWALKKLPPEDRSQVGVLNAQLNALQAQRKTREAQRKERNKLVSERKRLDEELAKVDTTNKWKRKNLQEEIRQLDKQLDKQKKEDLDKQKEDLDEQIAALKERLSLPQLRASVEEKLKTARASVGQLRINVSGPATELTVDDKSLPLVHDPLIQLDDPPILYVDPGQHRIEAAHHGRRTSKAPVEVRAGQELPIALSVGRLRISVSPVDARLVLDGDGLRPDELAQDIIVEAGQHEITATQDGYEPAHATIDVPVNEVVPVVPRLRSRRPFVIGASFAGTALAAGVTGAALTAVASAKRADVDRIGAMLGSAPVCAGTPGPGTAAQCQALKNDVLSHDTLNRGALTSFVVGGALAVAAAVELGVWGAAEPSGATVRKTGLHIGPNVTERELGVVVLGVW